MRYLSSTKRLMSTLCVTLLMFSGLGCGLNLPGFDGNGDDVEEMLTLSLEFDGLETLGQDYVYEGWLIVDGMPVSTGRFGIDMDGMPVPGEFTVEAAHADAATLFVLTIEPAVGDDPAPAATHVLAGEFEGDMAELGIAHAAALGSDFADAEGDYILETPSTGDVSEDYAQGIWWLDPAAGPGASLVLPALPEGWACEGWVVGEDGPISTGRFTMADMADADGAGATSGADGPPPFPGQDFIEPPISLIGFAAVISVEPEPDDSDAPFAIKPLVDTDIEDVGPGVLQMMGNNAAAAPVGTAMFQGS